jgi:hypothetical protein
MWLTASAWLPTELLAAVSRASGPDEGAAMAAGFGQDGPLDQLPPGLALAAFLAEASTGTSMADPVAASASGSAATSETASVAGSADASVAGRAAASTTEPEDGFATAPADGSKTAPPEASDVGSESGPFARLAHCDDSTLIGLIRGWRKQASLAAAAEHAAVAELAARRQAEAKEAGEWDSAAFSAADTEIAAALTLTSRGASDLIDRAMALRELPATEAALAAGRIDMPKALVMITGLAGQDPALTRRIEAEVIGRAPAQTTGQLRAALNRALLAADPDAAERRREAEEKQAYVERAPEPGGVTASLAGRHLPVTATVAAWNRITALARQLQANGAPGTLDQLRVQVYLALLSGQATAPVRDTGTTADADADKAPATGPAQHDPADPTQDGSADPADPSQSGPDDPAHDATDPARHDSAGPADPAQDDPAGPAQHDETDPAQHDPADPAQDGPADPAQHDGAGPSGTGITRPDGTGLTAPVGTGLARPDGPGPVADHQTPGPAGRAGQDEVLVPAGPAGLTGTVNLTVPLSTLLRLTDSPGDLGGFGPITAHTAREIAASALDAAAVRWCLTVTGETGQAIAHGCATRTPAAPARAAPSTPPAGHDPGKRNAPGAPPASGPPGSPAAPGTSGWTFSMKITALAGSDCGHQRESAHYRPPPSLWHLVQIRNPRCTAPGCRMPAARCDDDHTLAFDKGGKTCECNLGPLCRHHHRVKQSQGWRLEQPEPGIYAWVTPAGWQFITGPESYSA